MTIASIGSVEVDHFILRASPWRELSVTICQAGTKGRWFQRNASVSANRKRSALHRMISHGAQSAST